jgi:DNA-directed RNA polymerase specialized sigma24 family protein
MLPANVIATLQPSLMVSARAVSWSADEADEMAQEAWVRLFEALPKLKDRTAPALLRWLRSTLRDLREERGLARHLVPDRDELAAAGIL